VGATGAQGPAGPQGPQGPAGSIDGYVAQKICVEAKKFEIHWGTCEEQKLDGTDEIMLVAKR
jgi:hypothetical protein